MHSLRTDIEVELQQLERQCVHLLGHRGQQADYSGFRRECARVLEIVPADDLRVARERIDRMLARLQECVRMAPQDGAGS